MGWGFSFRYFALPHGRVVVYLRPSRSSELWTNARHRVPVLIVFDYFRYLDSLLLYQLAAAGGVVAGTGDAGDHEQEQ